MSRLTRVMGCLALLAALLVLPGRAQAAVFDRDNDGWLRFIDCNDRNAAVFPGAPELCDGANAGVDNDCDRKVDEGCPVRPEVTIVSPTTGQIAAVNGVVIQAVVTDDEPNPELSYTLSSSAGPVEVLNIRTSGAEDTVEVTANIPCGLQTLTLVVSDGDGLLGSDEVSVIGDDPPVAAIVSPADGDVFGEGFLVDLAGLANDQCQDPEQLEVLWVDNGELVFSGFAGADGTTSFILSDLEPGDHDIILVVQDPNGLSDEDLVTITVMGGETCNIDDDLALHYNFEEGSGTLMLDSSGNGNLGELFGTPQWVSSYSSSQGLALQFGGVQTFGVTPNASSLDATDEVTVVMWMRLDSLPPVGPNSTKNWYPILSKGEADQYQTERNYSMYVASNASTHFSLSLPSGTGTTNPTESAGKVTVGEWIQIAGRATINSGGTVTYFFNGQRDRVFTNRGNTSLLTNSQPLYLGKTLEVNPPFHGALDDVRVYPCALSDTQLQQLYNSTRN